MKATEFSVRKYIQESMYLIKHEKESIISKQGNADETKTGHIFFLIKMAETKKFQSAQYWTQSIASEKEKQGVTACLENNLTICRRGLLNFQAETSNSKSGNLSKKIILNTEGVLWTKVLIIVLFRIGGKGRNKVLGNKGNLNKL